MGTAGVWQLSQRAAAHLFSFSLNFLLHVNELVLAIVEFILQESQFLRGDNADSQSILHLPLALQAHQALVDIGSHVGMDMEIKALYAYLIDQSVNLSFELISK